MKRYSGKTELEAAVRSSYQKYIYEFEEIPEKLKDKHVTGIERSPAENLAYLVGWTGLLLEWEEKEQAGLEVSTPAEGYRWNRLGDLYRHFNEKYAHLSLVTLQKRLDSNVDAICRKIEELDEAELFTPHQRKWADQSARTAVWDISQYIHFHTIAPFGTFRTSIRKWKRAGLKERIPVMQDRADWMVKFPDGESHAEMLDIPDIMI